MSTNKEFVVKVKVSQMGAVGVKDVADEQAARDRVFTALRTGEIKVEDVIINKDLTEFTIVDTTEVTKEVEG